MTTVLVIEDDPAIRRGVKDALDFSGFATLEAADGITGRDRALHATYDLLLLDLVLPGLSGFEVLEALRAARPTIPVIILSARGEERDRVRGLDLGADDYVVKPFGARELLARVRAVLRRSAERPVENPTLEFPGGVADFRRREVTFANGEREELSEREEEVLRYLASHPGRAISREELIERIWRLPAATASATRTIDMHVAHLRAKLHDDPESPRVILTVRGKGYMLGGSG